MSGTGTINSVTEGGVTVTATVSTTSYTVTAAVGQTGFVSLEGY